MSAHRCGDAARFPLLYAIESRHRGGHPAGILTPGIWFCHHGPRAESGYQMVYHSGTATLGFGLFYTLMNVGFWAGAELADYFRKEHAEGVSFWGVELTTYQAIIAVGFLINIPDLIAILLMRDGAEMTSERFHVIRKKISDSVDVATAKLKASVQERRAKMTKELIRSLIATAIVGALAYALLELEVHAWTVSVIKAGYYVWAFLITAGICAVGCTLRTACPEPEPCPPGAPSTVQ